MTYSFSCEIYFFLQNQEKKVYFCQLNVTHGGNTLLKLPMSAFKVVLQTSLIFLFTFCAISMEPLGVWN